MRATSASASRKLTNRGLKYFDISYTFAVMPLWDKIDVLNGGGTTWTDGWVTWNRLFDPVGAAPGGAGAKQPLWRKVVWVNDVDDDPGPRRMALRFTDFHPPRHRNRLARFLGDGLMRAAA